jgi:hypothetical protein
VLTGAVATVLLLTAAATAATAQPLDKAQVQEFMLTAEVVDSQPIGRGVTRPWRLTLSDGTVTHDVGFQSVNEKDVRKRLGQREELNFVDAYRYNIAAYRVAELLGIDHMMPVTVERDWNGTPGAMTWWIDDVMMNEETRLGERRWPDDMRRFTQQYYRMLVFAELIYDTDRNQGNILYSSDWKLWMIDFSRAFRIWGELQGPQNVTQCDRELFERMRGLTREQLEDHTRPYLTSGEVDAVIERRDKLAEHFEALIEQKGERLVLY